jgi:hypothetical protein
MDITESALSVFQQEKWILHPALMDRGQEGLHTPYLVALDINRQIILLM